jgi:hypothetical protein
MKYYKSKAMIFKLSEFESASVRKLFVPWGKVFLNVLLKDGTALQEFFGEVEDAERALETLHNALRPGANYWLVGAACLLLAVGVSTFSFWL